MNSVLIEVTFIYCGNSSKGVHMSLFKFKMT